MLKNAFELNQSKYNEKILDSIFKEFTKYSFKDMIISKFIMQPLTYLINSDKFLANGFTNIYSLENIDITNSRICSKAFLILADHDSLKLCLDFCSKLLNLAKDEQKSKIKLKIFVFPCVDDTFNFLIEEEGLWEYVSIESLPITHFQYDTDSYGLMMPLDFENFANSTIMCLVDIFEKFGPIPNIYAIGPQSKSILKFSEENICGNFNYFDENSTTHGYLFLFDRGLDWKPMFLNSINFESLLSSHYTNNFGISRLISKQNTDSEQFVMVGLNNFDPLFQELRSLPITDVNDVLIDKMKQFEHSHKTTKSMMDSMNFKNHIANRFSDMKIEEKSLDIFLSSTVKLLKSLRHPVRQKLMVFEEEITSKISYKFSLNCIIELCNISKLINPIDLLQLISLLCISFPREMNHNDFSRIVKDFIAVHGIEYLKVLHNMSLLNIVPSCLNSYGDTQDKKPMNRDDKSMIKNTQSSSVLSQKASSFIDKIYTNNSFNQALSFYDSIKNLRAKVNAMDLQHTNKYGIKSTFRSEYIPLIVELIKYWINDKKLANIKDELRKICNNEILVCYGTFGSNKTK